ncbi:hypothetical protein K1T71_004146 [Dendrolimus kikuchii]|uniref:Uncharacterized protein n=1 Tax=Dendrolimus kikuchii TaxID=765133 RepID=A0ACC1DBG2_9NEOP|nr:hypothetical protein K1T71_004146 [Dendrolimus kikuchii]
MEFVLVLITVVLCAVLLLKLVYSLRLALSWRVNCWFCNSNFWVKYAHRNSWTCPKCEQYNGFTRDGDYNKPIILNNDQTKKTPKVFQKTPPKNGLCKMCNINQQLKVTQLANFVPMNENHFEEEIESYRLQLEKAYKLCSPCKNVLQSKLHKEKENLLGRKLLESRSPDRKPNKQGKQNGKLKNIINNISMFIALILIVLVSFEFYKNIKKNVHLHNTLLNIKEIITGLLERVYSIVKMKITMTFPALENIYEINNVFYMSKMPNAFKDIGRVFMNFEHKNIVAQKVLGGFVCLVQIIGNIYNVNSMRYTIAIDLLWSVFVITSVAHRSVTVDAVFISFIKMTSALTILLVYKSMKSGISDKKTLVVKTSPKRTKNFSNTSMNAFMDDDDSISLDTDDDVSLSKFGVRNFSESSNETVSPLNGSLINGRTFTPRSDSVWTKPKLNSTFCVNTVLTKSPISVSDSVFVKPSFNKYQKLVKSDSDSELDESISSLCIGSPNKNKKKTNSIFSLRKFTASPNFVTPMPTTRPRPLISPSKLGHSASWVAGGYWGSEGERHIFNIDGSRSSSQSSGFESQTSSMNQRNVFSHPPSREESICSEPMVLDHFSNMNNMGFQPKQNFAKMNSPVFLQMRNNGHVQIPQPRFPQQMGGNVQNNFLQPQYVQKNMFKAPSGSGLIKLPPANSFDSR